MTDAEMNRHAPPVGKTTVVIMSHNYGRYLGQAITSALTQTRRAAKIVVVDDASDDDTDAVVRPYLGDIEFHRVDYRSQQRTRNFGLSLAKSEYVLFLDADDYMAGNMLERLEDALDSHPQARLAYCDKYVFGNAEAMKRLNLSDRWSAGAFSLEKLRFKNFVMATSLMRRDCIESFDERIVRLTDWDTWLAILADDKHAIYVPEPLLHYRVHGENVSIRRRELIERLKILVKHGLIQTEALAREGSAIKGATRGRNVVLLTTGSEFTNVASYRKLAHRKGWKLRALVGIPVDTESVQSDHETLVRAGRVVLQVTPSQGTDDLFRRYAGVITAPSVDSLIVTENPSSITANATLFDSAQRVMQSERSVEEILSARSLEELGTFVLSPSAIRWLLYLPPVVRPTTAGRLRNAVRELMERHLAWRFRRPAGDVQRQSH